MQSEEEKSCFVVLGNENGVSWSKDREPSQKTLTRRVCNEE